MMTKIFLGGTVFALLVLIVLALLGGQLIKIFGTLLSKIFRVNISLPPLLGTEKSLCDVIILTNGLYRGDKVCRSVCAMHFVYPFTLQGVHF